jgi:hypothetical protein
MDPAQQAEYDQCRASVAEFLSPENMEELRISLLRAERHGLSAEAEWCRRTIATLERLAFGLMVIDNGYDEEPP